MAGKHSQQHEFNRIDTMDTRRYSIPSLQSDGACMVYTIINSNFSVGTVSTGIPLYCYIVSTCAHTLALLGCEHVLTWVGRSVGRCGVCSSVTIVLVYYFLVIFIFCIFFGKRGALHPPPPGIEPGTSSSSHAIH